MGRFVEQSYRSSQISSPVAEVPLNAGTTPSKIVQSAQDALSRTVGNRSFSAENNWYLLISAVLSAIIIAALLSVIVGYFWLLSLVLIAISLPISAYIAGKTARAAQMESLLNSYLGQNVAGRVMTSYPLETEIETINATVLFIDIRSFTRMTETVDKVELFRDLGAYIDMLDTAITAFGGTVNKFGGDSVLALFGMDESNADHACAALNASAAIVDSLAELNQTRLARGRQPFRVGIGIQTGDLVAGHLGTEHHREYTVLGDCVNVAKRLSDMSKEEHFYSIFIGGDTRKNIRQVPEDLLIDNLGERAVRGRGNSVMAYAVTPLIARNRVLPGGLLR